LYRKSQIVTGLKIFACMVSYNWDFSCKKTIFESLLDRFAGPENIYTKIFSNISFEKKKTTLKSVSWNFVDSFESICFLIINT